MKSTMAKIILGCFLTFSLMSVLSGVLAFGQAISGDIVGTITDQHGAAIPNATVTATNTATGVKSVTQSNASGEYRFNNLAIGNYDLSAGSAGFPSSMLENFNVELNKTATGNLVFSVSGGTPTLERHDRS